MRRKLAAAAALVLIGLVAAWLLRPGLPAETSPAPAAPSSPTHATPIVLEAPAVPATAETPAVVVSAMRAPSVPVAAVAVVAPVSTASQDRVVESLAWDEIEHDPPPYPWPVGPPSRDARTVSDESLVSLRFEDTPILTAIEYLNLLGVSRITLDAAARARVEAAESKVNLRLRDVSFTNAIRLVLTSDEQLVACFDANGVHLGTTDEPKPPVAETPRPTPSFGATLRDAIAWGPCNNRWRDDTVKALDRNLTFNFDETPLNEVVQFLEDFSTAEIRISKAIDGDEVKVTRRAAGRSLRAVLDDVVAETGLAWSVKNRAIFVQPKEEVLETHPDQLQGETPDPLPALRDRRVSFDLRGVNVSEAVAALAAQGIEAFASESAWRSRGTFSLIARNEPLGKALGSIAKPLRAWIAWSPREGHSEVVLFDGALASMRDALHAPVPPVPGFAAGADAQRRELIPVLRERRALRDTPAADPGVLAAKEAEADGAGRDVLGWLESRSVLAGSPGRLQQLRERLAGEEAGLRSETDEWVRQARALRVAEVEKEVASATKDLERLEARYH
jgi:hypothetical protein